METYLDSLCIKFSVIGLTETWLDETKEALYDIPEYTCINRFRSNRKGGGVTLAVKNGIPYNMRADLEYFDTEMEGLFIEIDKHVFDITSDLVIGIIYRMPNSSIDIFNDRLNDTLNIIHRERKICSFLGDLNIDLLKYEEHRPTSEFLDLIYSYNVFPLISKQTRITLNTATLIDHILINNFQYHSKHFQGILCSSISDHYAIFHLTDNCKSGLPEKIIKRVFNQANIQKFTERMKYVVWDDTLLEQDTQKAYSTFHDTLCQIYNKCFPVRKMN